MLILCTAKIAPPYEHIPQQFADTWPEHTLIVADRHHVAELLPQADILITERLTREMIDSAVRLTAVVIPYTGVDALPLDLLAARGITLMNNHGNSQAVAERALALALSLLGRIVQMDSALRQGDWSRHMVSDEDPEAPDDGCDERLTCWTSLVGRSVTILGTGSIGCGIARFLKGFDCTVTGYNRSGILQDPASRELFSRVTNDLEQAVSTVDIVFCALPLTPETRNLIHKGNIHLLRSKYLINIARGAIFEEQALYDSLTAPAGTGLAGAAIDVWYQYPKPFYAQAYPSRLPFHTLKQVVLSPHAASQSKEGLRAQITQAFASLDAFLAGEGADAVDLTRGY